MSIQNLKDKRNAKRSSLLEKFKAAIFLSDKKNKTKSVSLAKFLQVDTYFDCELDILYSRSESERRRRREWNKDNRFNRLPRVDRIFAEYVDIAKDSLASERSLAKEIAEKWDCFSEKKVFIWDFDSSVVPLIATKLILEDDIDTQHYIVDRSFDDIAIYSISDSDEFIRLLSHGSDERIVTPLNMEQAMHLNNLDPYFKGGTKIVSAQPDFRNSEQHEKTLAELLWMIENVAFGKEANKIIDNVFSKDVLFLLLQSGEMWALDLGCENIYDMVDIREKVDKYFVAYSSEGNNTKFFNYKNNQIDPRFCYDGMTGFRHKNISRYTFKMD